MAGETENPDNASDADEASATLKPPPGALASTAFAKRERELAGVIARSKFSKQAREFETALKNSGVKEFLQTSKAISEKYAFPTKDFIVLLDNPALRAFREQQQMFKEMSEAYKTKFVDTVTCDAPAPVSILPRYELEAEVAAMSERLDDIEEKLDRLCEVVNKAIERMEPNSD